jgi:hypothetical protein
MYVLSLEGKRMYRKFRVGRVRNVISHVRGRKEERVVNTIFVVFPPAEVAVVQKALVPLQEPGTTFAPSQRRLVRRCYKKKE